MAQPQEASQPLDETQDLPNPNFISRNSAKINEQLIPALDGDRKVVRQLVSQVALISPEFNEDSEENIRRIAELERRGKIIDQKSINAYRARNSWILELRDDPGNFDINKIIASLRKDLETQDTVFLRLSDAMQGDQFTALVRYIEAEVEAVVSVVTKNNPHGDFIAHGLTPDGKIAERDKDGKIAPAYKLEGEVPQAIKVTKFGRSALSRAPKPPRHKEHGLHPVKTRVIGISTYEQNKGWSLTHIIPNPQIAMSIEDNATMNYGNGGFDATMVTALKDTDTDEESQHEIGTDTLVTLQNGEACIFGLDEVADRINRGIEALEGPPIPKEQIKQSVIETVKYNLSYLAAKTEDAQFYIRICYSGLEESGGAAPPQRWILTVKTYPCGPYSKAEPIVMCATDEHRPKTGKNKLIANYAGTINPLKKRAHKQGFDDILSVDSDGNLEELTTSALILIEETDDEIIITFLPVAFETSNPKNFSKKIMPAIKKVLRQLSPGLFGVAPEKNSLPSNNRKALKETLEKLAKAGYKMKSSDGSEKAIRVETRDVHYSEIPKMHGACSIGTAAGVNPLGGIYIFDNIKHPADKKTPKEDIDNGKSTVVKVDFSEKTKQKLTAKLVSDEISKLLRQIRTGTLEYDILGSEVLKDLNTKFVDKIKVVNGKAA